MINKKTPGVFTRTVTSVTTAKNHQNQILGTIIKLFPYWGVYCKFIRRPGPEKIQMSLFFDILQMEYSLN
ncbi:hypothetical protein DLD82_08225 [Methanospirillum stamsii]|uniref:Uncharacterized protein n=1 Tax=Methanospirillum stamsii TaxID=1277351 RepID=A0A2V2NGY0_9EURY|nr:hypothetical protein DLD82_08225 [Methanospirillum stamsii]